MIELKLNREQFSDYCRRSPNKSLKTTEERLASFPSPGLTLRSGVIDGIISPQASSERLFARFPSPSDAVIL